MSAILNLKSFNKESIKNISISEPTETDLRKKFVEKAGKLDFTQITRITDTKNSKIYAKGRFEGYMKFVITEHGVMGVVSHLNGSEVPAFKKENVIFCEQIKNNENVIRGVHEKFKSSNGGFLNDLFKNKYSSGEYKPKDSDDKIDITSVIVGIGKNKAGWCSIIPRNREIVRDENGNILKVIYTPVFSSKKLTEDSFEGARDILEDAADREFKRFYNGYKTEEGNVLKITKSDDVLKAIKDGNTLYKPLKGNDFPELFNKKLITFLYNPCYMTNSDKGFSISVKIQKYFDIVGDVPRNDQDEMNELEIIRQQEEEKNDQIVNEFNDLSMEE